MIGDAVNKRDQQEVLRLLQTLKDCDGITREGLGVALGLADDRVRMALLALRVQGSAIPHLQGPRWHERSYRGSKFGVKTYTKPTLWTAAAAEGE